MKQQTANTEANQLPAVIVLPAVTVNAIPLPDYMTEQFEVFLDVVHHAKVINKIPNYTREGETPARYAVFFKQIFTVKRTEIERHAPRVFKHIERIQYAKIIDENMNDTGRTDKEDNNAPLYELATEKVKVGWKEVYISKVDQFQPTENNICIAFEAREGLSLKNVVLFALDVLAKRAIDADINKRSFVRKTADLHIIYKHGETIINTMETGSGIPARLLFNDFTRFVNSALAKVDRVQTRDMEFLPAIAAKLEK